MAECLICKQKLKEEKRCPICGFPTATPLFFNEKQAEEWKENAMARWMSRWMGTISSGIGFTIMPEEDGTILLEGEQSIFGGDATEERERVWKDIQEVAAGNFHILGLRKDGTVVAAGKNHLGQCDVKMWKNIVAIAACGDYSAGLDREGRVYLCGDVQDNNLKEAENWRNIIKISAGSRHIVGLRSDGTVEAVGDNQDEQCNVADWNQVTEISAGMYHTLGLTEEGKVLAAGLGLDGECDVEDLPACDKIRAEKNVSWVHTKGGKWITTNL